MYLCSPNRYHVYPSLDSGQHRRIQHYLVRRTKICSMTNCVLQVPVTYLSVVAALWSNYRPIQIFSANIYIYIFFYLCIFEILMLWKNVLLWLLASCNIQITSVFWFPGARFVLLLHHFPFFPDLSVFSRNTYVIGFDSITMDSGAKHGNYPMVKMTSFHNWLIS